MARLCSDGLAVVPMLGGYCVLTGNEDKSSALARYGLVCRLVDESDLNRLVETIDPTVRPGVRRILAGPTVGVLPAGRVALATEPLTHELLARLGAVWFAFLPDSCEPDELPDDIKGSVGTVVTVREPWQPGPTVVDFTCLPVRVDRRGKSAILDIERELGQLVKLGPDVLFSVMVVCTGNSCRSPMAAGMLSRMLTGLPVFVYSAGTDAPVGNSPTALAVRVANEYGADISRHRAQQLTVHLIRAADLVLVMDRYNRARVIETLPEAATRTRLLRSFVGGADEEIDDPVGRSLEFYRYTAARMLPALEQVAADIALRFGGTGCHQLGT